MTTNYRGAMVAPFVPSHDIQEAYGANLFRYQIVDPSGAAGNMEPWQYIDWVNLHLNHIKNVVAPALQPSQKVIVDLHSPPGGYLTQPGKAPTYAMYTTQAHHRDTFKNAWGTIVDYLGNESWVLAFDLLNEPAGTPHQIDSLYRNTIKLLRSKGYMKPCIVSTPYGDPARAIDLFSYGAAFGEVWYQVHMWKPLNVTHQGISGFPAGKPYPGPNTGIERVRNDLKSFKYFLHTRNVRGFVGEFGISTFADDASRVNYLRDITTVLEEIGADACYHAFRESPVWALTSPALELIQDWWGKNV